jgi:peptidoglycan/LPS O-acetylase OafA/YrhL
MPVDRPLRREDLVGVDALRALVMLQGVFFHAGLAFTVHDLDWAVRAPVGSRIADALVWASHGFRMHLFFLVAGFFAQRAFASHGLRAFAIHRLKRVGVPLLFGLTVVVPITAYAWVRGARTPTDAHGLVPAHLWFLEYLLTFYVAAASMTFLPKTTSLLGRCFGALLKDRLRLLWISSATALGAFLLEGHTGEPSRSFVPYPREWVVYAAFFGFGWYVQRRVDLLHELVRGAKRRLCIGVALAVFWVARTEDPLAAHTGLLSAAVAASFAWCMVLGLFGLFLGHVRPGRALRFVAKASFTLYLVHVPLVVYAQILILPLPIPDVVRWLLISALATGGSLAIYVAKTRLQSAIEGLVRGTGVQRSIRDVHGQLRRRPSTTTSSCRHPPGPLVREAWGPCTARPVPWPFLDGTSAVTRRSCPEGVAVGWALNKSPMAAVVMLGNGPVLARSRLQRRRAA